MADGTENGTDGEAPRTLFSLGRSGAKRSRNGGAPPDAEDVPVEDASATDDAAATADDPCPSCGMPLVADAVFCGECGTRRVAVDAGLGVAAVGAMAGAAGAAEPDADELVAADELADVDELIDADELVAADELVDEGAAGGGDAAVAETEATETEATETEAAELEAESEGASGVVPVAVAAGLGVAAVGAVAGTAGAAESDVVDLTAGESATETIEAADATDGSTGEPESGAGDAASAGDESYGAAGPPPGGGSKKGVLIGVGAVALVIAGILGVLVLGGGSKSNEKTDRVAAGAAESTTTTAVATTESTATAATEAPVSTDTTAGPDTVAPSDPASTTTRAPTQRGGGITQPPPAPPTTQGSARIIGNCPQVALGSSNHIGLDNRSGTAAGSFKVSSTNPSVSFGPATGSVPAGGTVNVTIVVRAGFDGYTNVTMLLGGGGVTQCSIRTQG